MKFDKELGMKRLGNFFKGIKNKLLGMKTAYQKYKSEEPERIQTQINRISNEVELEKKRNELSKLRVDKQKMNQGKEGAFDAFTQQKFFVEEGSKKSKSLSLDDGYSGIGKEYF